MGTKYPVAARLGKNALITRISTQAAALGETSQNPTLLEGDRT